MANILLIDDDTELTSLLKDILSFEGFTVSEANDGYGAWRRFSNDDRFDPIDVMMPTS